VVQRLATGWRGRGSNPGEGGARFSAPVQTDHGDYPASYTMGIAPLPGVKRPGRGVDHPPPSRAEVKVKSRGIPLHPLWAFVANSRVNLTLYPLNRRQGGPWSRRGP
jgi:hypothetical protein